MFDTVLVIFTNDNFIIPFNLLHGVQNEIQPVSARVRI